MKHVKQILPAFLPLALVITLFCGLMYAVLQQNYRISANDPQIQIAEDVAAQLTKGQLPQLFIPNVKTDISKSLGSFIIIYDKNGKLIGSSAEIGSKQPVMPVGVFIATKLRGETRFTWQPQKGTRLALVMVYYKGQGEGYVALGRSLREIERRIDNLGLQIFLGWTLSLVILFAFQYLLKRSYKN